MISYILSKEKDTEVDSEFIEKLTQLVEFAIEKFDLDRCLSDIEVNLVRRCDAHAGGFTWGDEEQVDIEIATHVKGNPLTENEMLTNLAHELVHAKQLIKGELIDEGITEIATGDDLILIKSQVWKGERYRRIAYADQPWEQEAYALESKIVEEFLHVK